MKIKRALAVGNAIALAFFLAVISAGAVWAGGPAADAHASSPNNTGVLRLAKEESYENGELVSYYLYAYNEAGQLCYEDYFREGVLSSYIVYEYDENGFLTGESEIDADDGTANYTYAYENDSNGNMIKRTTLPQDSGEIKNWSEFTYDENGNQISQIGYWSGELGFSYQRTFDEAGHMLTQDRFDKNGELELHQEYTYDEAGHLLSIYSIDNKDRATTSEYEWSDDFHTKTVPWFSSGELAGYDVSTYDDEGNLLRITSTLVDKDGSTEIVYYYE